MKSKDLRIGATVHRSNKHRHQYSKNLILLCECEAEIVSVKIDSFINGLKQKASEISAVCEKCHIEYVGGKVWEAVDVDDTNEVKRIMAISYVDLSIKESA